MDFTGRPMRGFVYVEADGLQSQANLEYWLELALAFNPVAKKSAKTKPRNLAKSVTVPKRR
jgi:hypothetical protein